jgi:hypothetical protein
MSRPDLVRVVFVDDLDIRVVEFIARHDAELAVDFEEGDRDHQGAGEAEGVVLGEGKIV